MNRGRGRGRGGASGPRPVARDDEGNVVEMKPEGPPALYPEKELPPLPDAEKAAEAEPFLGSLWGFFRASSFNLGRPEDRRKRAACNASLASVVTLDPSYFPKELYSEQQKTRGGSKEAQAAYWHAHAAAMAAGDTGAAGDDDPLGRLEELAKREIARERAEGEPPGGALVPGEDAEEDAEAEAYDEEDFVGDDDDPYKQFDDDEGYEDPDEDGGGDEAFY